MESRVSVAPSIYRWARARSRRSFDDLLNRFPKLSEWEAEQSRPTWRQLQAFARATHTPIGYFFLPAPPNESLPVADFRTFGDQALAEPSADLMDVINACELRQEWYRAYAERNGEDVVTLVGSLDTSLPAEQAAESLRQAFGFDLDQRLQFRTWTEALSGLIRRAEDEGVLVMTSGIVGNDTHRKLNPEEFRGFALTDDYAPLVFINGADSKAAQIFTLAHELCHIALGESAVSRPELSDLDQSRTHEGWCNRVAAELLVPASSIVQEFNRRDDIASEIGRLARLYKVSSLVVLRRLLDTRQIDRPAFSDAFSQELERLRSIGSSGSGGNFYNSELARTGQRFARALIFDTVAGGTMHGDALQLLGVRKHATFEELSRRVGVA